MNRRIAQVALLVRDYDEAITFFTDKLDFELIEDTHIPAQDKRWVLVAPRATQRPALLLAKASTESQRGTIGNQTGGRVFLFLHTSDFWEDYDKMVARGVDFVRPPRKETYGTVAVFQDLYGNLWDLLQPTEH